MAVAETLEHRSLMAADTAVDIAPAVPSVVARIVNGTPTSDYGSVGIIGDSSGGFCSGTLIAPRYALTAGHCGEGVANTAGRFSVGGQNYATSRVIVHPSYNNQSLANDIAIFELNQAVTGVTPSAIFRGTPQVGQVLTLVGFGAGGTGTTGHTNDFGTKRVGRTPIDGVEPTVIRWNFDNNTESNTAPGDSGGPAFLTVNQVDYVAGVTSGGTRDDAGIGDQSFDTRVDAFATWIDSIVGGSTTPPPPPPPPPPSGDDHANAPGSSATVVTLNSTGDGTAQGVLEIAGDRDVFQFTVLKAGTAVITTAAGASGLDTYLRIYNSAGTLVGQNDDYNQTLNSQVTLSVQPGVYYASIGSYQDAGVGAYQLSVKVTAATTGDKFSSAVAIPLASDGTGVVNSSISSTVTGRVFSFVAQFTGQVVATTRATSGNLDTILNGYDAAARRVATNDDYGGTLNSRVQFSVVAGSKYYLEVVRYGQTTGNFTLNLTNTNTTRARFGTESGQAAATAGSSSSGGSPSST
ncbi:MAG TPA: trypsin-like serine protease, partial [Pirellulaceae bacterium]|nr:trypsin-like serine protease [Pirellulaceae bacterium]